MADVAKHKFTSAKADGADATLVQPGDWNDEHTFAGGADGDVLVRDTAQSDGANWSGTKAPTLHDDTLVKAGGGSETGKLIGTIHVDTTQAQTDANTTEKTLVTFSLPANTLDANAKGVEIIAWGSVGSGSATKEVRLYFGATVISTRLGTTIQSAKWRIVATVVRTGASAQKAVGHLHMGAGSNETFQVDVTAPAEATTGAITIKVTGQNGAATAGLVVFEAIIIKVLN